MQIYEIADILSFIKSIKHPLDKFYIYILIELC